MENKMGFTLASTKLMDAIMTSDCVPLSNILPDTVNVAIYAVNGI